MRNLIALFVLVSASAFAAQSQDSTGDYAMDLCSGQVKLATDFWVFQ